MKNNRICFIHGDIFDFDNDYEKIEYFLSFFNLNKKYKNEDFIWDNDNPDLLFVSEHLYYGKNTDLVKNSFLKLQNSRAILIFVAGECIEPDMNLFDYAIVFDRDLSLNDRIIRLPFFVKFYKSIFKDKNNIRSYKNAEDELNRKKNFCNFIYSNGNAHPMRDKLFHKISEYKIVDSLGSHLRNVDRFDENIIMIKDWRLQSIKYKEKYKFSIASENASYRGYISEKIITSFQAHTIPIYFGDPEVAKDFNTKAFINYHDFNSISDMIDYIKRIDNDDKLWMSIIMEPWCTKEQYKYHKNQEKKYYIFFDKLFNSSIEVLYRKSLGYHPNNYRNNLFSTITIVDNNSNVSIIRKIIRKVIPLKLRIKLKKIFDKK